MTVGVEVSLVGKKEKPKQDPQIFLREFLAIVTSLEMVFEQPIPDVLVYVRLSDGWYDSQKQHLFNRGTSKIEEISRVLRATERVLEVEEGGREGRG